MFFVVFRRFSSHFEPLYVISDCSRPLSRPLSARKRQVVKVGFALIICQALQGVILDSGFNLETRIEVNRLYGALAPPLEAPFGAVSVAFRCQGSFLKALYTMFEITHSGSWPAVVRPIVERVNPWYAVLFLSYITLVVFAVIRGSQNVAQTARFHRFSIRLGLFSRPFRPPRHRHGALPEGDAGEHRQRHRHGARGPAQGCRGGYQEAPGAVPCR